MHPTCTDVSNRQSLVGSICLSIVLMALSFVFLSYDVFFDAIEIETLVDKASATPATSCLPANS